MAREESVENHMLSLKHFNLEATHNISTSILLIKTNQNVPNTQEIEKRALPTYPGKEGEPGLML